ncbi:MAG: M1 family metallopeptidase [Chitinophagales bacterium]
MPIKTNLYFLLLSSLLFITACSGTKELTEKETELDEVVVSGVDREYRAEATRHFDLIHTKLDVRFDWSKSHLLGVADITMRPYFYPTDSVVLDAKGFDINSIRLMKGSEPLELSYVYDSSQLNIKLDRYYNRNDTIALRIDYVAKPDELDVVGSSAIAADKGLYFINPLGKIPGKPRQIWTQGETEASSCWFPTIDKPNQRTTQEILITVDTNYTTLSNGLMFSSTDNGDGTRTDYWKQEKDHTPYLFMMAIGEFSIVEDEWNGMEVNYYVEPQYAKYAKRIFGNTPEMMTLYSDLLGYEYPWEKYNQVAVRDFVSGAMENTSASLFGEFVQRNDAELDHRDYESIVAHELFHQWFGDLVTCESWSNLALNESFATYGEYIWIEHKYGMDHAQYNWQNDKNAYLHEARAYQEDLIRFYYEHREEMFDRHTYQKGGLILHALRNYMGDDAFYAGIREYLHSNEFQPVEAHHLRLALEKVSGEDLNWFFNQWFYGSGHAELNIKHHYNDSLGVFSLTVEQMQDTIDYSFFKLPLKVAFQFENSIRYENIVIDNQWKQFEFEMDSLPENYIVDVERVLVGTSNYLNKNKAHWMKQFQMAAHYLDKDEALTQLMPDIDQAEVLDVYVKALEDNFYGTRLSAIQNMPVDTAAEKRIALLYSTAKKDREVKVRMAAIDKLGSLADKKILDKLERLMEEEKSNIAKGRILKAIKDIDEGLAFDYAKQYTDATEIQLAANVADLFVKQGGIEEQAYFKEKLYELRSYSKYYIITFYGDLLKKLEAPAILNGAEDLKLNAIYEGSWYIRKAAGDALYSVWKAAAEKAKETENTDWQNTADSIEADLQEIMAAEKTERVIKAYEKDFTFEL